MNLLFRYICKIPGRLIADITDSLSPLVKYVNSTCLVNGNYSVDITNYWCIGNHCKKF